MNIQKNWRLIALFTGVCLCAFAETEEKIQRKFDVAPEGTLIVEIDFGSIEVFTNSENQVSADIHRKVSRASKSREEEFLKERPVIFSQEGGNVVIRSHKVPEKRWNLSDTGSQEALYRIAVPARFMVDLHTSGGRINVKGTVGETRARTSGGALGFSDVQGAIDGLTSGGAVTAQNCEGRMRLRTSGGGMKIERCRGDLDAQTSGGNVDVAQHAGPANVKTSGGYINIRDTAGALEARTSGGNVRVSLRELKGPVDLDTSGGHIALAVPAEAAFVLNADTSAGYVNSELPVLVQGKSERGRLSGKVNGGGPTVRLHTSGGHIDVTKR